MYNMSNRFYFDRGILAELEYHSNHLESNKASLNTITDDVALVKAELYWLNNHNTANTISNSQLIGHAHQITQHNKTDTIFSELAYMNNHGTANTIGHSVVNILAKNTQLETLLTTIDADTGSIDNEIKYQNNTGASGSISHSGVQILAKNTEIKTGLDTLETTMTNCETDLAALEVLNTSINTHIIEVADGKNSVSTLYSNGSLAAANYSTTIDMSAHRHLSIFGSTSSSSGTIYLAFSTDDVNYYIASSLSMSLTNVSGTYYFGNNYPNIGAKYVRVYTTALLSSLYLSASIKN